MSQDTSAPLDTRQRILDIATELFRDRGYAGTSIRDIAEGLGMTKAALYYHFTCKDDVLTALVAPTAAAIDAFLARAEAQVRDDPAGADPARLLREFVAILARHAPAMATALNDPVVLRSDVGRFRFEDKHVRLVHLVAGPGADDERRLRARAALGAVRGAMEALAPRLRTGPGAPGPSEVERYLDVVVACAVAALDA